MTMSRNPLLWAFLAVLALPFGLGFWYPVAPAVMVALPAITAAVLAVSLYLDDRRANHHAVALQELHARVLDLQGHLDAVRQTQAEHVERVNALTARNFR
ncbi:MAG TPA: hypothetical protein VD978_20290 [Azospirillum sp.]|nr:hypothetical protein [Azospirillum sp.]